MTEDRRPSPLLIRRFMQLPRPSREVWQGGIVMMPTWIASGPGAEPVRPYGAVWVSLSSGLIHLELEKDLGQHGPDLALDALVQFGLKRYKGLAGRPARIQVADPALGEFIVAGLGDAELAVETVPELQAVGHVLRMFAEDNSNGPLPPGPFSGEGVTPERMRGFAEAAAAFWRAEPWQFLTDEDTLRVESPDPPSAMSHVTVLGNAGISCGMHLTPVPMSADELERLPAHGPSSGDQSLWALFFGAIDEMPFEDADLWLAGGLPVAQREAYPWLVKVRPGSERVRADATKLAFVEGVLRALAATTEADIDAGRWTKSVRTSAGPADFTLALPLLLPDERDDPRWRPETPDPRVMERMFVELERYQRLHPADSPAEREALMDRYIEHLEAGERPAAGQTPIERAQDLVFDAFGTRGRRRTVLARQALALDPDAADAHLILAEQAAGPARALPLYERAVEAARHRVGPETFEGEVGRFWDLVYTRPYMRAMLGLSDTLVALGRHDEAARHLQDMLRLDPTDMQGARYRLLRVFLAHNRQTDAETLVELFADDTHPEWRFGEALLAFRREGDSPASRRALLAAIGENRHVPRLLAAAEPPEDKSSDVDEPGSLDEAILSARQLHVFWHATPGAVAWLKRVAAAARSGRSARTAARRSARGRRPRR